MTEKEKMLNGEQYDCGNEELQIRWHKAKEILREYNYHCASTNTKRINELLTDLLGNKGKNVWITAPFFCDYGENIHIGNNTEINHNCIMLDCNRITIGSNVLIGPNSQLLAVTHPIKASERIVEQKVGSKSVALSKPISAPITIGDNVWLGAGVIVMPGVTIGEGTTIGAGSVVTKSIPANTLAYGNPCKVIKKI